MNAIAHLPKINLTQEQIAWLTEAWRLLKETGNNPAYRILRLNTVSSTGDDFEPSSIDERLVKEKSTQITLLGVLHIENDYQILNDFDRIILAIRKMLIEDSELEDIFIGEIASKLKMDKKYAQIVFTLGSHYGSFWSSAGSTSSAGGPFGYERFSVKQPYTFDSYISFKSISLLIDAFYKRQEEYDKNFEWERSQINASSEQGRVTSKSDQKFQNDELFPEDIFDDTRGYVKKIASQASMCYRNALYDASFVMIRKLIETLIIEAFERHRIATKIKDAHGHYLFLSDLIGAFLNETSWTISRNTKSGLPRFKKFADLSAHNRRFLAKKVDIDKLDDLRIIVEEIIHLIDYPTWELLRVGEGQD